MSQCAVTCPHCAKTIPVPDHVTHMSETQAKKSALFNHYIDAHLEAQENKKDAV